MAHASLLAGGVQTRSLLQGRPQQRRSAGRLAARAGWFSGAAAGEQRRAVDSLLQEVEATARGLSTSAEQRQRIEAGIERLVQSGKGAATTGAASLSATWRLVWTTEKETLFILQNAGLFGTKAGEVFQVIDVNQGLLQNVITFPPEGAFIVDSDIAIAGPQRVEFKFSGAKLKLPSRDFGVPPVGKGWFDNVFIGNDLRIAKDSRGDTLVVVRDGPPRIFS